MKFILSALVLLLSVFSVMTWYSGSVTYALQNTHTVFTAVVAIGIAISFFYFSIRSLVVDR